MDPVFSRLQKVFRTVLRRSALELTRQTSAQDVKGWDSFAHINLIIATEKEFKIRFKTSDITGLKNIGEIADLIEVRLQAQQQSPRAILATQPAGGSEPAVHAGPPPTTGMLTVVRVYAPSGSRVCAGDQLFDVEDSKATQEISAQTDGIVVHATMLGDLVPAGHLPAQILDAETTSDVVKATEHSMRAGRAEARTQRAKGSLITPRPGKRSEIDQLSRGAGRTMLSIVGVEFEKPEIARIPGDFFTGKIVDVVAFEAARLMRKYPRLNAAWRDTGVELHRAVNAGVAFDEGGRLVVYGIADADRKGLPEIRAEIEVAFTRYVEHKLIRDELSRATFSITDISALGINYIFPILPVDQAVIIGIARSTGDGFGLYVGYDHRISEGLEVARFLNDLRDRVASYGQTARPAPRCFFCDKPARAEVEEFHGRGLLKLVDAQGDERLICHVCWSGW
jgi:acyl carrier protein